MKGVLKQNQSDAFHRFPIQDGHRPCSYPLPPFSRVHGLVHRLPVKGRFGGLEVARPVDQFRGRRCAALDKGTAVRRLAVELSLRG